MKKNILGVCLLLFFIPNAFSADVSMRGFASVVAGQTLDSDESIYGYDDDLDFRRGSLAAIQFGAELDDGLSATVQMVARGANDFEVNVEWAYVTYEFNDSVQLTAGRMVTPFYRYSDFLDVGYTYPWVEVPNTVYGVNASGLDGLSLLINSSLGGWDSTLQLVTGTMDQDYKAEGVVGFSWLMNRDWLTLRAGYFDAKFSIDVPDFSNLHQLFQGVGAQVSAATSVAVDTSMLEDYALAQKDDANFGGLAVGVDYNDWLVDFEYIAYETGNNLVAPIDAYYLLFGKRLEKFTPFITLSKESGDVSEDVFAVVPTAIASVPVPQLGGATIPQTLAGVIAAGKVDKDVLIAGLRYDFHDSAALKVEYTKQTDKTGVEDDTDSIIRIGIDLIF